MSQALELVFEIGEELKQEFDWQFLVREQTFVTAAAQEAYTISVIVTDDDLDAFIGNSMWDVTNNRHVRIISYSEWQTLQNAIAGGAVGIDKNVAQFQDQLHIFPTPTAIDTLVFFYKSSSWIKSSGGARQADFLADTDISFFNEYLLQLGLRYLLKKAYGLPYEDEFNAYTMRKNAEAEKQKPKQTIRQTFNAGFPTVNTPEIGFG